MICAENKCSECAKDDVCSRKEDYSYIRAALLEMAVKRSDKTELDLQEMTWVDVVVSCKSFLNKKYTYTPRDMDKGYSYHDRNDPLA